LRVRRAGFAYRRSYDLFLKRYKSLCPKTWPNYQGSAKEGVALLTQHLGYKKQEFALGKYDFGWRKCLEKSLIIHVCRTKIFIRYPKTLFETEDAFQAKKNDIAVIIQCRYKGRLQKKRYQQMRWAAVIMQKYARRFLAKREMRRRRLAVEVLRRY